MGGSHSSTTNKKPTPHSKNEVAAIFYPETEPLKSSSVSLTYPAPRKLSIDIKPQTFEAQNHNNNMTNSESFNWDRMQNICLDYKKVTKKNSLTMPILRATHHTFETLRRHQEDICNDLFFDY